MCTHRAHGVLEPLPFLPRIKSALFVFFLMNKQIPVVHRDVKKNGGLKMPWLSTVHISYVITV